jgi:hypothetical protein
VITDFKEKFNWKIHPFAWTLKETAQPITLDEEHTEYAFVRPDELKDYDHVPQLELGLRRITVNQELEEMLEVLSHARSTGDSWQILTHTALDFLSVSIESGTLSKCTDSNDFFYQIKWYVWQFMHNALPDEPDAAAPLLTLLSDLRAVKRYYWKDRLKKEDRKKEMGTGMRELMAAIAAVKKSYSMEKGENDSREEEQHVTLTNFRMLAGMRILAMRKRVVDGKEGSEGQDGGESEDSDKMPREIRWLRGKSKMGGLGRMVEGGVEN